MSSKNTLKIPFGLHKYTNKMLPINQVRNGLSCDCICPECKQELIAKNKGKEIQHHFAHSTSKVDCINGLETSVHLMAKQIIAEDKNLHLPDYIAEIKCEDKNGNFCKKKSQILYNGQKIYFDKIELENPLEDIRPDITAYSQDIPLIIEIFVSNKVNQEKIEKIKKLKVSAIEINLSSLLSSKDISLDSLKKEIHSLDNIKWLYNKKYSPEEEYLCTQFKKEIDTEVTSVDHTLKNDIKLKKSIPKQSKKYNNVKEQEKTTSPYSKYTDDLIEEQQLLLKFKNLIKDLNKLIDNAKIYAGNSNDSNKISVSPQLIEVEHGEWLFGCSTNIWQSLIFNILISHKSEGIFVKDILLELKKNRTIRIPFMLSEINKLINKDLKLYDELPELLKPPPTPDAPINQYLNHLMKLGHVEQKSNRWFYKNIEDSQLSFDFKSHK